MMSSSRLPFFVLLLIFSAAFSHKNNSTQQLTAAESIASSTSSVTTTPAGIPGNNSWILQGRSTPTAKKISLKRSGDFFVLPFYVGSPYKEFSVKLDTSSSNTFLFGGSVDTGRVEKGESINFVRYEENSVSTSRAGATKKYNYYYASQGSSTFRPLKNEHEQLRALVWHLTKKKKKQKNLRAFFTDYAFDGSAYVGTLAMDSVQVGGIKMKRTEIGVVTMRSTKGSLPALNDITGFDGVLGLGITRSQPVQYTTPPIFDSIIKKRNSKTMAKTKAFSLYICSDGQAGQLHLGGGTGAARKNPLIEEGSKIHYFSMSKKAAKEKKEEREGKNVYQGWAIDLVSAAFQVSAIEDHRVAIIDSSSPFITAPKQDIDELFKDVHVAIHWPAARRTTKAAGKKKEQDATNKILRKPASPLVPMFPCADRGSFGTLGLVLGSGGGDPMSVEFTGKELLGVKVEDQQTYPGMCKLLFSASAHKDETEWRLGVPFLAKVGYTVFDNKYMRIGFGSRKHSDEICGSKQEDQEN